MAGVLIVAGVLVRVRSRVMRRSGCHWFGVMVISRMLRVLAVQSMLSSHACLAFLFLTRSIDTAIAAHG